MPYTYIDRTSGPHVQGLYANYFKLFFFVPLFIAVFSAFLNNGVFSIKNNGLVLIAFIAIMQSPVVPNTPPICIRERGRVGSM